MNVYTIRWQNNIKCIWFSTPVSLVSMHQILSNLGIFLFPLLKEILLLLEIQLLILYFLPNGSIRTIRYIKSITQKFYLLKFLLNFFSHHIYIFTRNHLLRLHLVMIQHTKLNLHSHVSRICRHIESVSHIPKQKIKRM